MNLLLYGPPGSGKGTQAEYLRARFGIPQIATGDILRAEGRAGTELGIKAKELMDRGELVPDEVMIPMVRNRLQQPDAKAGFILDGFPRTVPQARALDNSMSELGKTFNRVLYLRVPTAELIKRLSGRLVCPVCGRTFHQDVNPPGENQVCPHDGTELIIRDDDSPDAALKRIEIYLAKTVPVLDYYRPQDLVSEIDGTGSIDQIRARIVHAIGVNGDGEVNPR
jgi:adenylate kinase